MVSGNKTLYTQETTTMSTRTDNWQGMNWIRQEKRLAIYMRDNFVCQHCQLDLKRSLQIGRGLRIELDHLVPVSQGGGNEASNLVTSCSECNLDRSDTNLFVYHSPEYAATLVEQARKPINVALAKQVRAQMRNEKKGLK